MNELNTGRFILNDFIEENAEAIFIVDNNFRLVSWNRRCYELLGIGKEIAIGQELGSVAPVFDDQYFKMLAQKAMTSRSSIAKKSYTISATEFSTYVVPSFSPIRLSELEDRGCMVILRQTELSERPSKFKPLIAESPIATAIYRPDGSPTYFNKAYSQLWGATKGMSDVVIKYYNIFEDEQLEELGLTAFIRKAFLGEATEIPPIAYNPYDTASIRRLGLRQRKYVKGHVFPIKDEFGEVEEVVMVLSDITFQKQAEEILTDTHLKFQMLTLGLPGVIYEYEQQADGFSRFKYISQGCNEMFGFSPEEIMKDASLLNKTIHPDDLEGFLRTSGGSSSKNSEWQWEGRILVEGKEKWIEGKSSPTMQKDGTIIRYGLLLDITDKKEVEKRYKLTEERLQLALRGAELGLWEWDLRDKKTIFNKAWAAKYGYSHQELELQFDDWGKLIHPEDFPYVKQKLTDHLKGNTEYFEAEYRFRTKGGSYRWILDKGRAVHRDQRGRVTKASGTYLDINEKKSSQLLIQRNEQLFTQLFENSPLGIVLLDEQHRVIQMNQGFKDMFGYSTKDIIGNQLNNILVPKGFQQEAIDINLLTVSGKVGTLESHRTHKNGSLVPVIIYGVPVTLDNKTIGIYGIYVDISARTRAENELQIRNNELDHFVYKVSHDLRAPLSSILGLVNLAQHQENDDDLLQYIGLIENRVKQLDHFINDVLSHSKNLKLAITVDPINFNDMIEGCFTDLSYLPNAQKVNIKTDISSNLFYSDRWRINEIFRNLISNAIKYLNPDIDDPYVEIEIEVTDDLANIRFRDNGIGIEEDTLPKVFEMFYRATEYSEGSGIGLYIVKNAIEKLGGKIKIESLHQVGTFFDITVPNSKEAWLENENEK
ncbi:PAS domain S-box protein [Fulvivirga sp. 29W222]|uniref:histidine kinase n=1 Tax=Fulvivirga marina TaxID=2494733 RepID=A0A937KGX7_9BACT|nr:PAS domain S-box protein [Fulvivirga marina]MBL6449915.1 PAS domain S-box protein [Fulvivirga marina]